MNYKRGVVLVLRLKALKPQIASDTLGWASLCIKLHEAHRLALPAAKQKEEEEEMETSEPRGLKLFDGSQMPQCCGAFCDAEPEHSAQRSSRALSWRCHWNTWTKNIPKNWLLEDFFSSTSKKKKRLFECERSLQGQLCDSGGTHWKIYFYTNCRFTILPKFCNCFL